MAQQHDPQRRNDPREEKRREEQFPGQQDRPDKVQTHQPNREGGGRSRDQGNREQQPPDRGRQENREQRQGRSGESKQNEQRSQGGERR